ncbi:MAG: CopD family protein [Thermoleophilia bacterium]
MRAATWLACGLIAAIALAAPATGSAHADLRSSEPAAGAHVARAPDAVRLVFSVPVETAFLRVTVADLNGVPISGPARRDARDDRAVVVPLQAARSGRRSVTWTVLSQDGHAGTGSLAFAVDGRRGPEAARVPQPPAPTGEGAVAMIARLLALLGPVTMLGLAVLAAGVVAPAARAGGVAPPGQAPGGVEAFRARAAAAVEGGAGGWWTGWWAAAGIAAVGVLLQASAVIRALGRGAGDLGELLADTRVGHALLVQTAALIVAAVAALALRRRGAGPPGTAAWGMALGAGPAAALVAISWSGHASTGSDRTLNIAIDAIHNLATAAWLGGLMGLASLAIPAVRALDRQDRTRLGAGVVVRFSALALTAVAVLVVTGVYRALAELGSLGDLVDTGYGVALLVKLALFAVLLLGGAYNRMIVHPRLERAALGLEADDRGAASALRLSVRAELVLAAGVLVSVGVLISQSPPG